MLTMDQQIIILMTQLILLQAGGSPLGLFDVELELYLRPILLLSKAPLHLVVYQGKLIMQPLLQLLLYPQLISCVSILRLMKRS
jgi:hypothetical protein